MSHLMSYSVMPRYYSSDWKDSFELDPTKLTNVSRETTVHAFGFATRAAGGGGVVLGTASAASALSTSVFRVKLRREMPCGSSSNIFKAKHSSRQCHN